MDPTPAQIEAEFPGWHVWQDASGMWYAARESRLGWLRDENLTELRAQIASWQRVNEPALQERPGAARERREPRA